MSANQATFPVRRLCRVLGVSGKRLFITPWQQRPPSERAMQDGVLTERILAIHAASDETYGSPNIHAELHDEGTRVGRKRVARLMRQAAIRGVSRRRSFTVTACRDPKQRPALDLVNRRFVADMTYVPTWAGFVFLAIVLRLSVASRRSTSKGTIFKSTRLRLGNPYQSQTPLESQAITRPRKRGNSTSSSHCSAPHGLRTHDDWFGVRRIATVQRDFFSASAAKKPAGGGQSSKARGNKPLHARCVACKIGRELLGQRCVKTTSRPESPLPRGYLASALRQ